MERNFRDSAREFGYEPWTSFTFFEWYIASRMIKKPTIQLMRERLFDPQKAHPDWFITFAKAIEAIGFEDCASAENLYSFVSTSIHFRRSFHWRREFKRRVGWMLDSYDLERKKHPLHRLRLLQRDRQWLRRNVFQNIAPDSRGNTAPDKEDLDNSQPA